MINYDEAIFNIDIAGGKPSVGSLLISEPFLMDDYFRHSVICMVEYESDKSSMGFVLNHSTGISLAELIPGITRQEPVPVFCGGPMSQDRLYYIHTLGELIADSRQIAEGLYIGGSYEEILQYVNAGYPVDGVVRFFVGYSGWSRFQLDEEISDKVWTVSRNISTENILTGSGDNYWHHHVKSLGPEFRGWLLHPKNPQAN